MTKPRTPALLASILLLAFILRVLLPIFAIEHGATKESFHGGDTREYVDGAMGFINEGIYYYKGDPIIKRPPGYPLLLVPGILLGHLELISIILQILLGTFSVFLVWKISGLLFEKESIALVSSFLFAIEPLSIFYSSQIFSETLFVFVWLYFVLCFLQYLKVRNLRYLLLSAIFLSLCVYVRTLAYYLPIFVVMGIFFQAIGEKKNRWEFARHAAIFFLVCTTIIGAWKVRNFAQTGYSGYSTQAEMNLYFYFRPAIKSIKEGKPFQLDPKRKWENFLIFYEEKYPNEKDPNRRYAYMKSEGLREITENPGIFMTICLKGLVKTLLDPGANPYLILFNQPIFSFGSIDEKGGDKNFPLILNIVFGGWIVIYWVLAITGIFPSKFGRIETIFLILLTFYIVGISAGPYGYSRFRLPIMPVLCVLGGAGFFILRDKFAGFILRKAS